MTAGAISLFMESSLSFDNDDPCSAAAFSQNDVTDQRAHVERTDDAGADEAGEQGAPWSAGRIPIPLMSGNFLPRYWVRRVQIKRYPGMGFAGVEQRLSCPVWEF